MKTLTFVLLTLTLALFACTPAATPTIQPPSAEEPTSPAPPVAAQAETLKACWVYPSPIAGGWAGAHDRGRVIVDEQFSWLETAYVEKVSDGDSPRIIDRLVQEEHCNIVFTASFGYMEPTIAAGEKYPEVSFWHVSGFMRRANVGTLMSDFYQEYYANGLAAGAVTLSTGSHRAGYVGAHPFPEVIRHINAFALGLREVDPEATLEVTWIFSWYDPEKARQAADALIANGANVLVFTEDSDTIPRVAQEYTDGGHPVYSFGHYNPMIASAPTALLSGQIVHWEALYADILSKIYAGAYTTSNLENVDYWWLLGEGGTEVGVDFGVPINPIHEELLRSVTVDDPLLGEISVYDLILRRIAQMKDPARGFDPFTGPITDQDGNVVLRADERADYLQLTTPWMNWFAQGVSGDPTP